MSRITHLQSQLNELLARKTQLSNRLYYTDGEEKDRLPRLQAKIDCLIAAIQLERALINNITVVSPEVLDNTQLLSNNTKTNQ